MTKRIQAINKLMSENKLKEYSTINLGYIGYYLNYGTTIVKHNEVPTLTTKSDIVVVVKENL